MGEMESKIRTLNADGFVTGCAYERREECGIVAALDKRVEKAMAEIVALEGRTQCAYCGATFEMEDVGLPELVDRHVRRDCPKHPMREAERERDRMDSESTRQRVRAEAAEKIATHLALDVGGLQSGIRELSRTRDEYLAMYDREAAECERLRAEVERLKEHAASLDVSALAEKAAWLEQSRRADDAEKIATHWVLEAGILRAALEAHAPNHPLVTRA